MVDKSLEIDLNPTIDSPTTGNRNVPTNGGGIINRILSFPLVHYVFSQPPIFTFLVSMLFLSFCLLPLGGYVSNNELPDFDLMMVSITRVCKNMCSFTEWTCITVEPA